MSASYWSRRDIHIICIRDSPWLFSFFLWVCDLALSIWGKFHAIDFCVQGKHLELNPKSPPNKQFSIFIINKINYYVLCRCTQSSMRMCSGEKCMQVSVCLKQSIFILTVWLEIVHVCIIIVKHLTKCILLSYYFVYKQRGWLPTAENTRGLSPLGKIMNASTVATH